MQANVRTVVASSAVRTRLLATTGIGALLFSLIEMVRLHVATAGQVNPFAEPMSGYAWLEPGKPLLEASVVWLSIGSLALFAALITAGLQPSPTMFLLLGMWVAGLALAALFPASRMDWTFSGLVHWFASLAAFLSLPCIGFLVAKQFGTIVDSARLRLWVLRISIASTAALVVYGVTYLPSLAPDWSLAELINGLPLAGLTQRLSLVLDVALLTLLGVGLMRLTDSRDRVQTPGSRHCH